MRLALVLLAMLARSPVALAQNPISVQAPEQLPSAPAQHERTRNLTETYQRGEQGRTNPQGVDMKQQCMAIVAVDSYCTCLQSKLPDSMGFDTYVLILSRSKEANKYSRLDADAKLVYDALPKVRDFCASKVAPAQR